MEVLLKSEITCPKCGYKKEEDMPTNACQFFYECENCKTVLKPKILLSFDIFIPFATDKATLIVEKLPGPLLTRIEKFLSIFTLYLSIKFNIVETIISLF